MAHDDSLVGQHKHESAPDSELNTSVPYSADELGRTMSSISSLDGDFEDRHGATNKPEIRVLDLQLQLYKVSTERDDLKAALDRLTYEHETGVDAQTDPGRLNLELRQRERALQEQVDAVTKEKEAAKINYERLNKQAAESIRGLQRQLSVLKQHQEPQTRPHSAQSETEELRRNVLTLQSEQRVLEDQCERQKQEIADLSKRLLEVMRERDTSFQEAMALSQEVEKLLAVAGGASGDTHRPLVGLPPHGSREQGRIGKADGAVEEGRDLVKELARLNDQLREQVRVNAQLKEEAGQERDQLREEMRAALEEREGAKQVNLQLKEQAEKLLAEVRLVASEKAEAVSFGDLAREETGRLRMALELCRKERDAAVHEVQGLREEVRSLAVQVMTVGKLRESVTSLERECARLRRVAEGTAKARDEAVNELDQLKVQVRALEEECEALAQQRDEALAEGAEITARLELALGVEPSVEASVERSGEIAGSVDDSVDGVRVNESASFYSDWDEELLALARERDDALRRADVMKKERDLALARMVELTKGMPGKRVRFAEDVVNEQGSQDVLSMMPASESESTPAEPTDAETQALRLERDALKAELLASSSLSRDRTESLTRQVQQLTAELERLNKEKRDEAQQLLKEIEDLHNERKQMQLEQDRAHQQVSSLMKERDNLQRDYMALDQQAANSLRQFQEQIENLTRESDKLVTKASESRRDLQERIDKLLKERDSLIGDCGRSGVLLQAELTSLRGENQRLREDKISQEAKMEESSKQLWQKIEDLARERSEYRDELRRLSNKSEESARSLQDEMQQRKEINSFRKGLEIVIGEALKRIVWTIREREIELLESREEVFVKSEELLKQATSMKTKIDSVRSMSSHRNFAQKNEDLSDDGASLISLVQQLLSVKEISVQSQSREGCHAWVELQLQALHELCAVLLSSLSSCLLPSDAAEVQKALFDRATTRICSSADKSSPEKSKFEVYALEDEIIALLSEQLESLHRTIHSLEDNPAAHVRVTHTLSDSFDAAARPFVGGPNDSLSAFEWMEVSGTFTVASELDSFSKGSVEDELKRMEAKQVPSRLRVAGRPMQDRDTQTDETVAAQQTKKALLMLLTSLDLAQKEATKARSAQIELETLTAHAIRRRRDFHHPLGSHQVSSPPVPEPALEPTVSTPRRPANHRAGNEGGQLEQAEQQEAYRHPGGAQESAGGDAVARQAALQVLEESTPGTPGTFRGRSGRGSHDGVIDENDVEPLEVFDRELRRLDEDGMRTLLREYCVTVEEYRVSTAELEGRVRQALAERDALAVRVEELNAERGGGKPGGDNRSRRVAEERNHGGVGFAGVPASPSEEDREGSESASESESVWHAVEEIRSQRDSLLVRLEEADRRRTVGGGGLVEEGTPGGGGGGSGPVLGAAVGGGDGHSSSVIGHDGGQAGGGSGLESHERREFEERVEFLTRSLDVLSTENERLREQLSLQEQLTVQAKNLAAASRDGELALLKDQLTEQLKSAKDELSAAASRELDALRERDQARHEVDSLREAGASVSSRVQDWEGRRRDTDGSTSNRSATEEDQQRTRAVLASPHRLHPGQSGGGSTPVSPSKPDSAEATSRADQSDPNRVHPGQWGGSSSPTSSSRPETSQSEARSSTDQSGGEMQKLLGEVEALRRLLERSGRASEAAVAELRAEKAALRKELEVAKAEVARLKGVADMLEMGPSIEEMEALKARLMRASQANERLKETITEMANEAKSRQLELYDAEEAKVLREEVLRLKSELQRSAEAAKAQSELAAAEIKKLQAEIAVLQETINRQAKQHAENVARLEEDLAAHREGIALKAAGEKETALEALKLEHANELKELARKAEAERGTLSAKYEAEYNTRMKEMADKRNEELELARREEEQRLLEEEQLVRGLKAGAVFTKYDFHGKGTRLVCLTLSDDSSLLRWGDPKKIPPPHSVPIVSIADVLEGATSDVFKRRPASQVDPTRCLSVVFGDRTLDLVTQTVADRDKWLHGLRLLKSRMGSLAVAAPSPGSVARWDTINSINATSRTP